MLELRNADGLSLEENTATALAVNSLDMMVPPCNASTQKAEADDCHALEANLMVQPVPHQSGLQWKALTHPKKFKEKKELSTNSRSEGKGKANELRLEYCWFFSHLYSGSGKIKINGYQCLNSGCPEKYMYLS